MADTIAYSDTDASNSVDETVRLLAALVSGQMPNGTAVYPPVELYGKDYAGDYAGYLRERVTSAFPVITTDHASNHEGIAYTLSGTATVSANYAISIETPADKYVHLKPVGITASGGPVVVTFVEGSTYTGGSALTPRNRKRTATTPDLSTVTCKGGVTPSGGTIILTALVPGETQGAQKIGATTSAAEEVVLKRGTTYTLQLSETATGDVTIGYDLFWYEEGGA